MNARMNTNLNLIPFAVAILLVFTLLVSTQMSRAQSAVNGYVTDATTGETLIGASVGFPEINRGASSNTFGYYSITDLRAGTYTLQASFIGYQTLRREITLGMNETLRLDLALTPSGVELEEVVVTSEEEKEEQRDIGRAQITTKLIKEVPAVIEPDLFRSVQLLPGVASASDFSSGLYIRGGSPDQTLILLDETTVYNPSHFFGFFSTFNPDAVKDVRLYKGGYPAEYGGRIGSVLSVYNKDGNRNRRQGTVSLGLLASRASVEGPVGEGSYMLAVRRSTLEPLLAALRQSTSNVPDLFYFYDINGKITQDLSDRDRLSVAFYAGNDNVKFPFLSDAEIRLDYGNQTVSSQYRRIFSETLFGFFTLTGSRYFNKPRFDIAGTPFQRDNDIFDFSLKADFEYLPSAKHTLSTGLWAGNMTLKFLDQFDGRVTFTDRIQSQYLSVYVQDRWTPTDRWIVNGGVRLNHFSEGNYTRIAPRFSVEHRPAETIRLQAAYGRYHQFLTLITNEAFSGFDLWLTTDEGVSPAYGDQFVLGTKTIPFRGYALDAEVYYRTMRNLFELNPFIVDPSGLDYAEIFRFGKGYAYGFELFAEKQSGRLTGFVGYTFGVTRRQFPGFNTPVLDRPGEARFYPPQYDGAHDISVVLTYRLSGRWSASAVWNYNTGQAYTQPLGRTQFPNAPWDPEDLDSFTVGRLNNSRLPDYHRLDLAFARRGNFFGIGEAEWQIQLINAYSRRNIWFYNYDFDENPVERTDVTLLPVLPSVSYTVQF